MDGFYLFHYIISWQTMRFDGSAYHRLFQGRIQPLTSGWAKKYCPHFPEDSHIFPQILFMFFLILVFRVGGLPTREGPAQLGLSVSPLNRTIERMYQYSFRKLRFSKESVIYLKTKTASTVCSVFHLS